MQRPRQQQQFFYAKTKTKSPKKLASRKYTSCKMQLQNIAYKW